MNSKLPTTQKLGKIGDYLISQVHKYNLDILGDLGFYNRSDRVTIATSQDIYARSSQIISASLSSNLIQEEDFL